MINELEYEKRLAEALGRRKEDILAEEDIKYVKIRDCNDPIINISEALPDLEVRLSEVRKNYVGKDELFARSLICGMLREVKNSLPEGYNIRIYDGYRPLEYQKMRFDQKCELIAKENPSWSAEEVKNKTFIYIFPPNDDERYPPPHSTGGAVDLTFTKEGVELDTGNLYGNFDDSCYTNTNLITKEQMGNRKFIISNMLKVGFLNYPGEWWHFMFGEREWAAYSGLDTAIFGRADLISGNSNEN